MSNRNHFQELYPFKSHFLQIEGLNYHYLDEGSGPAVVMLHGNPTWSFYYRNLVLGLRDTHRVIVPDHIGCGLSDKPQDYSYRLENHVKNLTTLLNHLDLPEITLVVHDWGGPIGLGWAVQFPEKINKMVVFNTTAFLSKKFPLRILMCKLPVIGDILIRGCNFFALGAVYMASKNREKMTAVVKQGYLKPYNSYTNRIANLRFVQDIPLTKNHPSWQYGMSLAAQLDKLSNKPTLICWGDKDFCFTELFLNEWKRRFPRAQVHRFPYAGHYVVEDAIDEIQPLVKNFLER